jgi:hypothetical protein
MSPLRFRPAVRTLQTLEHPFNCSVACGWLGPYGLWHISFSFLLSAFRFRCASLWGGVAARQADAQEKDPGMPPGSSQSPSGGCRERGRSFELFCCATVRRAYTCTNQTGGMEMQMLCRLPRHSTGRDARCCV